MHLIITLSDIKQLKHSQIPQNVIHNNDAFNIYFVLEQDLFDIKQQNERLHQKLFHPVVYAFLLS